MLGRGNPLVKGMGNLREARKERARRGIAKVAGSGQDKKKITDCAKS